MDEIDFRRGVLPCVLAALAWALLGPVSRVCFAEGMSVASVSFWRVAVSGLCFLIHAGVLKELRPSRRDFGLIALFGMLDVPLFMLTFQVSILLSGGAVAVILLFTAPAWVAVFSRLLFHEGLGAAKLAAMGIAMAGTGLVCLSGGSLGEEVSWIGLGSGLLSGFLYAMQFPFLSWWGRKYSTASMFAMMFLPAAAVLLPFIDFAMPTAKGTAAIGVLSIISTYVAYFLFGISLRRLTPVQAAIIGNVEPVAGLLLSWWLWNEDFTAVGWVGCALVLVSVLILSVRR
ncbi:MAG: EamA family transporter [Mailhella sp.]|nr:EamA family transporter [Mailhella sp.]